MEIWLDAHISPLIAKWIRTEFSMDCFSIRELDLLKANDILIFNAAKQKAEVVIITKDEDFRYLLNRLKAPPKIIWLTFGNCSNTEMKDILKRDLLRAIALLNENDLVEISK